MDAADLPALVPPLVAPTAGSTTEGTCLDSQQLLQGRRELWIRHGDAVYRLCHTRNDKLILVK